MSESDRAAKLRMALAEAGYPDAKLWCVNPKKSG